MSIRQINLDHSRAASVALLLRLTEGGADLVLVQEPWVVVGKVVQEPWVVGGKEGR